MKTCIHCHQEKPLSEYNGNSANKKDKLQNLCRDCEKIRRRKQYLKDDSIPDRVAKRRKRNNIWSRANQQERNLRYNYGITVEERNLLLDRQGGGCAICGKPAIVSLDSNSIGLEVDHDHDAEERDGKIHIRGLLCGNCNTGIGLAMNNPLTLEAGADYVEKYA